MVRPVVFCLILVLPWIPAAFLLSEFLGVGGTVLPMTGEAMAVLIATTAPLLAKDASLFGEVTPVAIAGALTFMAPTKRDRGMIRAAVAICVLGWLGYLVASQQLQAEATKRSLAQIIEIETDGAASVEAVQGFVTGTRIFYLIIGASLVGISLRRDEAART